MSSQPVLFLYETALRVRACVRACRVVPRCGVSKPAGRCHPAGQEILAVASQNATLCSMDEGAAPRATLALSSAWGLESMDGMAWHGNGDSQRHGTSITPTTTTNAHGCLWIIAANNHDNVEVNKELN